MPLTQLLAFTAVATGAVASNFAAVDVDAASGVVERSDRDITLVNIGAQVDARQSGPCRLDERDEGWDFANWAKGAFNVPEDGNWYATQSDMNSNIYNGPWRVETAWYQGKEYKAYSFYGGAKFWAYHYTLSAYAGPIRSGEEPGIVYFD